MVDELVDLYEEFLVVRHGYLNGDAGDLMKVVDDTTALAPLTNGRKPITVLEGDLVSSRDGSLFLTHHGFYRAPKSRLVSLRAANMVSTTGEALDRFQGLCDRLNGERAVLCFEIKHSVSSGQIYDFMKTLKDRGIEDAYFDSFHGKKLDVVAKANIKLGTGFKRSYHRLAGNIGDIPPLIPFMRPDYGHDFVVTQRPLSFGKPLDPFIYGAVGSEEQFRMAAEVPEAVGAYARFSEGTGVRGFVRNAIKSATNLKRYRSHPVVVRDKQF